MQLALKGMISLGLCASVAAAAEPTKAQLDFFEAKIRPIFADNCYKCHSAEQGKSKGDLTLDTRAGWSAGGKTGHCTACFSGKYPLKIPEWLFHDEREKLLFEQALG